MGKIRVKNLGFHVAKPKGVVKTMIIEQKSAKLSSTTASTIIESFATILTSAKHEKNACEFALITELIAQNARTR